MPGFFQCVTNSKLVKGIASMAGGGAVGFGASFLKDAGHILVKGSLALAVYETVGVPAAAAVGTALLLATFGVLTKKEALCGVFWGTIGGVVFETVATYELSEELDALSLNPMAWEATKSAVTAAATLITGLAIPKLCCCRSQTPSGEGAPLLNINVSPTINPVFSPTNVVNKPS